MTVFSKIATIIAILLAATIHAQTEGVIISKDNAANPDPSAMLEIQSTTKGVLIPRMSTLQRTQISNAADGLLVFDSQTHSFWFKTGAAWVELSSSTSPTVVPRSIQDTDGNTKVQTEKNTNENIIRFDLNGAEKWKMSGNALEPASSSVLIGNNVNDSGTGNIFIGNNAGQGVSGNNKLAIGTLISGDMTAGTMKINNAYTLPGSDGSANQVLQTNGSGTAAWASASSGVPVGTILAFGGDKGKIPAGFLLCDGSPITKFEYPELYAAIGTNWGGATNVFFNLPDLRGQFLRGWNDTTNIDPDASTRFAKFSGGNSGNKVGTFQNAVFEKHNHGGGNHIHPFNGDVFFHQTGSWKDLNNTTGEGNSSAFPPSGNIINMEGGSETRPKNAFVNYIIKY